MDETDEEIRLLVGEKRQIEATLTAAGGQDFHFLLEDCTDLADLVEEMREVSSKRSEKEHAAFDTKVKFSRRIRRKAKDLNRFEKELVGEYEKKHITFEHGRKMAIIIKHLRLGQMDDAESAAGEFYALLEMGARLERIDDILSRKRAQVERGKRGVSEALSELEKLDGELPPDPQKISRHDERVRLKSGLAQEWSEHVQSLKSMPLGELLGKIRGDGLGALGFPKIPQAEAESMSSFLRKSGLESKTAGQLCEMAGQSEQRLRHSGIDLAGFRQEVVAKRAFLFAIMSYQAAEPPAPLACSPALAYLSEISPEAARAALRLAELGKTAEADGLEWERVEQMKLKKAKLAGVEKSELMKSLRDYERMEGILDGKMEPVQKEEKAQKEEIEKGGGESASKKGEEDIGPNPGKNKGVVESVWGFFVKKKT